MADNFSIPQEYEASFRRILPYLAAPLQTKPDVHASLLLYLKMGGEKLVRAAIDAFNVSYRLEAAELMRLLREEALESHLNQDDTEDEDQAASNDDDDEDEDEPAATKM